MKTTKNINIIDRHVANKLRKFRFDAGLSQKKLAEHSGISFQQVQKYESMKNKISIVRLFEFSQILEISIASFFEGLIYQPDRQKSVTSSFDDDISCQKMEMKKEFLSLVKAFSKIEDKSVRNNVLALVQDISRSRAKK